MPSLTMSRRTSLVVAAALAALATLALFSYIRGLERQALGRGDAVEILVAKDTIPSGTAADAAMRRGLMGRVAIPAHVVVAGAIANLEEIAGRVAAVDILKGEQIVGARFVSPEQARSAFVIPDGRQAMSVEVGSSPGVAGHVQRGDRISIIAKAQGAGDPHVQFLVQDVEVLAVGTRVADDGQGDAATSGITPAGKVLLTLALTPQEAEKVAYAAMDGNLWLTLLPPGQQTQTTPGRGAANLFS